MKFAFIEILKENYIHQSSFLFKQLRIEAIEGMNDDFAMRNSPNLKSWLSIDVSTYLPDEPEFFSYSIVSEGLWLDRYLFK